MLERYKATMILAAVGDAIGYKNGSWQFNHSGKAIHESMMKISNGKGVLALKIGKDWDISDDTVMHIASAQALVAYDKKNPVQNLMVAMAKSYKKSMNYMEGRAPGVTCINSLGFVKPTGVNWDVIKYSEYGGGCGASMRSACIGLYFVNDLPNLIKVSIEAGRITHHNPIGYLGGMIAAYFTRLAIKSIPPQDWLTLLFTEAFPLSENYIKENREAELNLKGGDWQKSIDLCIKYANARNLEMKSGKVNKPLFPEKYGVEERQQFYLTLSLSGWPGALGIDSVLIAYDALLSSGKSWEQLCLRSMLHGGDSDSTGTIAAAWFGALYGFMGVPQNHTSQLVCGEMITKLGVDLFNSVPTEL